MRGGYRRGTDPKVAKPAGPVLVTRGDVTGKASSNTSVTALLERLKKNPNLSNVQLLNMADWGGLRPRNPLPNFLYPHRTGVSNVVLSKRERFIAIGVAAVLGLLVADRLLLSPLLARMSEAGDKTGDSQRKLSDAHCRSDREKVLSRAGARWAESRSRRRSPRAKVS